MYPSPRRPDFGIFVARIADQLRARGHEVDEAVVRAGARGVVATPLAYAGLLGRTLAQGRRRQELRAAAPAGVRFAGRVLPKALVAEIHAHDVVCQPSLVEPQGQVLLEALACGRPVVATRVGGPAEIVTPACGVLVDPLDV